MTVVRDVPVPRYHDPRLAVRRLLMVLVLFQCLAIMILDLRAALAMDDFRAIPMPRNHDPFAARRLISLSRDVPVPRHHDPRFAVRRLFTYWWFFVMLLCLAIMILNWQCCDYVFRDVPTPRHHDPRLAVRRCLWTVFVMFQFLAVMILDWQCGDNECFLVMLQCLAIMILDLQCQCFAINIPDLRGSYY